jgi:drug/metabolite transporter (DMT)-like permease
VLVLGEEIVPLALVGTALVVLGAWITSRRETSVTSVTVTN